MLFLGAHTTAPEHQELWLRSLGGTAEGRDLQAVQKKSFGKVAFVLEGSMYGYLKEEIYDVCKCAWSLGSKYMSNTYICGLKYMDLLYAI